MTAPAPRDPGLQPERTRLAWRRTVLATAGLLAMVTRQALHLPPAALIGFMSLPFIGYINVGMAMGLAQFVTTFLITWLYVRHANNKLDPLATEIREDLEGTR